jgi:hypothetical protein
VEVVLPTLQESERLASKLICLVVLASIEMDPGDALQCLRSVGGRVGIQRSRVRGLQVLDGSLLVSQEEREAAQHEMQAPDVPFVVHLLVQLLRPLRVAAGKNVVALPLRDQRGLEIVVGHGSAVADRLGELEPAIRVVPGRDVVAHAPMTARAPVQDLRAELVAGEL